MSRFVHYACACVLPLGILPGIVGIASAIDNTALHIQQAYGQAWWRYPVLSNGGTGVVLLLITTAFALMRPRRGTHLLAALTFLASYFPLGIGVYLAFLDIEKGGAPGTPVDATIPLDMLPGVLITAVSLLCNYAEAADAEG